MILCILKENYDNDNDKRSKSKRGGIKRSKRRESRILEEFFVDRPSAKDIVARNILHSDRFDIVSKHATFPLCCFLKLPFDYTLSFFIFLFFFLLDCARTPKLR